MTPKASPPAPRVYMTVVGFMLPAPEAELLHAAAARAQVSTSELLRRVVRATVLKQAEPRSAT